MKWHLSGAPPVSLSCSYWDLGGILCYFVQQITELAWGLLLIGWVTLGCFLSLSQPWFPQQSLEQMTSEATVRLDDYKSSLLEVPEKIRDARAQPTESESSISEFIYFF